MPDRRHFLGLMGTVGGAIASSSVASAANESVAHETKAGQKRRSVLRVALMQAMPAANDQQRNLEIAESYCRRAAEQEADILLMPEMWNIGYRGFDQYDAETTRQWQVQATAVEGPWVGRLQELAGELNLAIAATYLQRWEPQPRNALSLIDRHGNVVLNYGKVHTCDFAFEAALAPGDGWSAVNLDTAIGPVRLGAMICFDREFPESARCLMLKGAEVVLTPNACQLDALRLAQFQVRAYENSMAMVMANYPAPQNNGQSVAFDAAGSELIRACESEGLYFADIDLDALRSYRANSLWGNAWRRPHRYDELTRASDLPIFRRANAYGDSFDPSNR